MPNENVLDALVVGAGFSGIYILHQLRKRGFTVKVLEGGSYMGGTWYWNRYPGARVDSEVPIYQFQDEDLWDFPWTERFPRHAELRQYFRYLDNKLNLSKDIQYNTFVTNAKFDDTQKLWKVTSKEGETTLAKQLFLCTGSTTARYVPPFEGLDRFKGHCYHSYYWPKSGVDFKDKRVAIIGTGATGVQIIQELGPIVKHLTVYQRTPNHSLPSQNAFYDDLTKRHWFPPKEEYAGIYEQSRKTMCGFIYDFIPKNTKDDSEEERRKFYEYLYDYGSFSFWMGNYQDMLYDKEANDIAYNFWAEKTRARVNDPVKKDLLAPLKPLHPFGTKRPCLETNYYEMYNLPHVDLIDVRDSPIIEVTENGVRTEKEGVIDVDIIILATGFDSLTGSIKAIDIRNGHGEGLKEEWKANGTKTFMGFCATGFPNLWFMYGPQGPTPLGNGVTIIEQQGEWLVDFLVKMRENRLSVAEAKEEDTQKWQKELVDAWESSLMPKAESWYQGANIPGKTREPLAYLGGYSKFQDMLKEIAVKNYNTFQFS